MCVRNREVPSKVRGLLNNAVQYGDWKTAKWLMESVPHYIDANVVNTDDKLLPSEYAFNEACCYGHIDAVYAAVVFGYNKPVTQDTVRRMLRWAHKPGVSEAIRWLKVQKLWPECICKVCEGKGYRTYSYGEGCYKDEKYQTRCSYCDGTGVAKK